MDYSRRDSDSAFEDRQCGWRGKLLQALSSVWQWVYMGKTSLLCVIFHTENHSLADIYNIHTRAALYVFIALSAELRIWILHPLTEESLHVSVDAGTFERIGSVCRQQARRKGELGASVGTF